MKAVSLSLALIALSGCSRGADVGSSLVTRAAAATTLTAGQSQSLTGVPGVKIGKIVASGASANMIGLRSDTLAIGRRTDSRTLFIYNAAFSSTQHGFFEGSDTQLLAAALRLLQYMRVPAAEVTDRRVLQEKLRSAHYDRPTRTVGAMSPVLFGHRYAVFRRAIGGIPIFTSRAWVGLMPDGSYGDVTIHWPDIPRHALLVAEQYRALIRSGQFTAPPLSGARVLSSTAGIVHSPADALVMDVVPAIRVIYKSTNTHLGKLPVLYVDSRGRPVVLPRVFVSPPPTWHGKTRSRRA